MPFLRVAVDGQTVASIATDDLEVVAVWVGGTRVGDDYADLGVTGDVYARTEVSDHRIWIDHMALSAGQVVEVTFLEIDTAVGAGRSIEELYPQQGPVELQTSEDNAELFAKIRQLPQLREGFTIRVTSSSGLASVFTSTPAEHGFGFSVLWNSVHPERASVSLHGYTVDSVESGGPGRIHIREHVPLGGTVLLELIA